ncbi:MULTISPECIES: CRISPR-associated protein Cas4 [Caproicibacterium]|uniref:CRISPR-associated exonuclease Cas4 n=1 Tax=Caproicibacterium lactatifermentans TaxID=2666138 RepID=A0A859DQ38_9FIRM|nr:CRISPR-associated protein Cas4 [Caproicibacterium lactatifermentans]ARP50464.1 CRISPR-associated protein Cas4 [Ruminococcaceae bacterium CPB6]MDD4808168.1 CRISPR-associated protein Cas4 [Oscillospiraceae bacterium]QKN23816.1 CRISPR-associated protein Cas4 [Caproicibacterium lactatifermentans]QKO31112.1 CRISPR-associated protein Cas4 [Caproicibacterium lactatifermentans]
MPAAEEDYRQLSELQHFSFCRRQWALIHIEQQWSENLRTAEGSLMHNRVHDESQTELRGDTLVVRGMRVKSDRLGAVGICDAVEFHKDDAGITLYGREGRWLPRPVEYKHGRPKSYDADKLQLCGQAMCLEEMLCCRIASGDLFYGEPHRRTEVLFTQELRSEVESSLKEMNELYRRGYTPKVKRTKSCNACSLKDVCLPELNKAGSAASYLKSHTQEDE